jgi:hypothetical protein
LEKLDEGALVAFAGQLECAGSVAVAGVYVGAVGDQQLGERT